jgi:hypothetical protein
VILVETPDGEAVPLYVYRTNLQLLKLEALFVAPTGEPLVSFLIGLPSFEG